MPIVVKLKKGKSKDDLIGEFRRICMEEEIKEQLEKRVAYEKPSQKRYQIKKMKAKLNRKARRRAR
jgi:ribosomal protein S21